MVKMKRILRVFHANGRIEKMKVVNEYHAQNVLSLLFVVGDSENENYENDVVFAELLKSKIFAYRDFAKNEVVIRNATSEFLDSCNKLQKKEI